MSAYSYSMDRFRLYYILFDEGGGHRWRVTDPTDDDHDDIDFGQKSTSWSTAVNMYKYVLCCVDIFPSGGVQDKTSLGDTW